jgi:L-lactate dehydrogenase
VLTLSAYLRGQYGLTEGYLGLPVIVNREGAKRQLELRLEPDEVEKLHASARTLQEAYRRLDLRTM